jgi:hypothetical protein
MFYFLFTFVSELTYQDSFGNDFVIENSKKLPKRIDFDFLKCNLNTKHFIENFTRKSYNYKFVVMKVQKKSKNLYELKVQIIPQTKDDMQELFRYTNPSYYILKTTNRNKKLEIESVKFDRGEI